MLAPLCEFVSLFSLGSPTATDALLADASRKRPRNDAGRDALQASSGAGQGQGQGLGFDPTGPGFLAAALPLPSSAGPGCGLLAPELAPGTLQSLAAPGLPVVFCTLAPSLGGSAVQVEAGFHVRYCIGS